MKKKHKKIIIGMLISLAILTQGIFMHPLLSSSNQASTVYAQTEEKTPITIFYRETCKHCHDEMDFLESIQAENNFDLTYLDVENEGKDAFLTITNLYNIPKNTPLTLVGDIYIQGFDKPDTTGKALLDLINQKKFKPISLEEITSGKKTIRTIFDAWDTCDDDDLECALPSENLWTVSIPFMGNVNLKNYTLPGLSIILGFIDGFNPCAMWVLVTFLVVLIKVGDRKKMYEIAGLFIIAEAIMYYFILQVWFTTWNFTSMSSIITPIVGVVAVGGGVFFLYEAWKSKGECTVTNLKQRKKMSDRIKEIASKPFALATAGAVIALAFSVNIIEFVCSIGIPQTFTKIIEINEISFWHEQFLMLLYIIFYMIDDFIVFGLAIYGADKLALTSKYSRITNALGGVIMIILGILLVFAPDKLVL